MGKSKRMPTALKGKPPPKVATGVSLDAKVLLYVQHVADELDTSLSHVINQIILLHMEASLQNKEGAER